MVRRSLAVLAAVSWLTGSGYAVAQTPAAPGVKYRFQTPWNGIPQNAGVDGWHVLGIDGMTQGADTGVVVFLSRWHAARKCWGSDRDCRPVSWAVRQRLSYVGALNATAHIRTESLP